MNAIEAIVAEHQAILEALDAFQVYVTEVERGTATRSDLVRFVELLEQFIESHHRSREEELLLATMNSAGVEVGAEALSMSRDRHGRARGLLAALRLTAARQGSWTESDKRTVIEVGRSYSGLLREHLHWELRVLVPILQTRVSGRSDGELPPADAASPQEDSTVQREIEELRGELTRAYQATGAAKEHSV